MARLSSLGGNVKNKILLVSIPILIVLFVLCWFLFCYTGDLTFFPENGKVKYCFAKSGDAALIDTDGNCYIRTTSVKEPEDVLGLSGRSAKQYLRRYKVFKENTFVRIYDGGDAQSVQLFGSGGTIITTEGDCYLFLAHNDAYSAPTLYCGGVKKAVGKDDGLYVLTSDGQLRRQPIQEHAAFVSICDDVVDFSLFIFADAMMVLRKNGDLQLWTLEKSNDVITVAENVKQFSADDAVILDVKHNGFAVSYGGIDDEGRPFICDWIDADPNALADSFKTAETQTLNIPADAVAVYGYGFLVQTKVGDVLYYGRETFLNNPLQNGTLICDSASMISADFHSACIVKTDGSIVYGGEGPCDIDPFFP